MGDCVKKFISAFLIVILLTGCTRAEYKEQPAAPPEAETVRGVWLFYRELSMADEKGGTAEGFRKKINRIFDNCTELKINTVFFHVRPFGDSFYPSGIFPLSEYLTGKQGGEIDYDPLEIAVKSAHERNISLHAWINPFRISFSDDESLLADTNPALRLIKSDSSRVYRCSGGMYYNPSCEENHRLIIDGVREIVNNYDVDGIHIDDYFYPDTSEKVDKIQYENYIEKGGRLSLEEWRIQCVNSFVSGLYSAVKSADKNIIVSISPAGNINNNYKTLYADVKRWGSTEGYCDWLIPQLYYGFFNDTLPYEKAAAEWKKITTCGRVKLIAGLGAYKMLSSESEEWKNGSIIERQWQYAEKSGYEGLALFSYSSIISESFRNNGGFLRKIS